MSIILYRDLCYSCKYFADGLIAHWTDQAEKAIVEFGDRIDSVEAVQEIVNIVWAQDPRRNALIVFESPVVVARPISYSKSLGALVGARYLTAQHEIVIAPRTFPVSRWTVLHEIAHGIANCLSNDLRSWHESPHGQTFTRIAFGLYRDHGLLASGVDPERVAASAAGFQRAVADRTKCALQTKDTRTKKAIRRILPSYLTKH